MEKNTITNMIAYGLWIIACATLNYIAILSWGTALVGIPMAIFTVMPMVTDARRYLNREVMLV